MKYKLFKILLLLVTSLVVCSCQASTSEITEEFQNPSKENRPWVYWYWMNGNVTKEGALADIAAMDEVGIEGALQMDVGLHPAGPVRYRSEEWWDIVTAVANECAKRDMKISFNCPGWALAGGPWITPETTMQEVTFSQIQIDGGRKVRNLELPMPSNLMNHYREIATFAIPEVEGGTRNLLTAGKFYDINGNKLNVKGQTGWQKYTVGNDKKYTLPCKFDVIFKKPVTARSVVVWTSERYRRVNLNLYAWDEVKKDWQLLTNVYSKNGAFSYQRSGMGFEEVKAKKFRFDFLNETHRPMEITRLELNSDFRLDDWPNKAGYSVDPVKEYEEDFNIKNSDIIPSKDIVNVTKYVKDGKLTWNAPKLPNGKVWTILRMGHTPTGKQTNPPLAGILQLEADKLSKEAARAHFYGMWNPVFEKLGPEVSKKVLFSNHIDSYEAGWQNWTPKMAEEFKQRNNYDIIKYLPTLTGRIINSQSETEAFLWDFKHTISDMYSDNFYSELAKLIRQAGLNFTSEPYGGPFNHIETANNVNMPIMECWWPSEVASKYYGDPVFSGRTTGAQRIGYEALTSGGEHDKFAACPSNVKPLGDKIFASGINWFVIHVYAQQPFIDPHMTPGFTCGQNGIHFDRGNTWFKKSSAWVDYLSRCQFLLREGQPVADVLYYTSDTNVGPSGPYSPGTPTGYEFDVVAASQLQTLKVNSSGQIVLPIGKTYELLVYSNTGFDTNRSLEQLYRLARQGATILGTKPAYNPSLKERKNDSAKFQRNIAKIWGTESSDKGERKIGKGRVMWGYDTSEVLDQLGVVKAIDYYGGELTLQHTHRKTDDSEIFFVANVDYKPGWVDVAFRAPGMVPTVFDPQTGEIRPWPVFEDDGKRVKMSLFLESTESLFVIFKKAPMPQKHIVALNQKSAHSEMPKAGNFTMLARVKPEKAVEIPVESDNGVELFKDNNFMFYPGQGEAAYGEGNSGIGLSVGTNAVAVFGHWNFNAPAIAVYELENPINDFVNIAVTCQGNDIKLYVDGKMVRKAKALDKVIHPLVQNNSKEFKGQVEFSKVIGKVLSAAEIKTNSAKYYKEEKVVGGHFVKDESGYDKLVLEDECVVTVKYSDGDRKTIKGEKPLVQNLSGSWEVQFPAGWGAPEKAFFPELIAWNEHSDSGIRYFSGTATYVKNFDLASDMLENNRRLYLDLGKVEIMAQVKVNGKDIGVLWREPFRLDITDVVKAGSNVLEVEVVNNWSNRLIGDEQYPDDASRDGNWKRNESPGFADWFKTGDSKRRPEKGRLTFVAWKHFQKDDALQPSGLIGPVKIEAVKIIDVSK